MMFNFYNSVYIPMLSLLVAGALMFMGHLILLELKHLRNKHRMNARRRQAEQQGVAIVVRGLGHRTDSISLPRLTSNKWTVSYPKMDSPSATTFKTASSRQTSVKPLAPATGPNLDWAYRIKQLGSAGRG
jgi:hypothetical protein